MDPDTPAGKRAASLRPDGFVSLHVGEDIGELLTRPFALREPEIFVNADVAQGVLKLEVCEMSGAPIEGFRLEDCQPVTGNGIALKVRWSEGADGSKIVQHPIRLRVRAQRADLYSVWMPNGDKVPYELNISFYDAINNPKASTDEDVKRFMASQAILLSTKGVPGIYIHSLLGSRNNTGAMRKSGMKRGVNRQKLKLEKIEKELRDKKSLRHRVFKEYLKLLGIRKKICQFNPYYKEKTIKVDQRLLITKHSKNLIVIINVSGERVKIHRYFERFDLIRKKQFNGKVLPYGVYYLA